MLTATPINNRLSDFRHMVELFTRRRRGLLRPHARRQQPPAHFNNLEKELRKQFGGDDVSRRAEHVVEAQEILAASDDLPGARRPAQPRLRAREPDPRDRQRRRRSPSASRRRSPSTRSARPTASCSTMFEKAFSKDKPLFTLADLLPARLLQGRRRDRSTRSRRTARSRSSG